MLLIIDESVGMPRVAETKTDEFFPTAQLVFSGYKFFKGCLPQVLLGPFLNTLSHLILGGFNMEPTCSEWT